jgi:hypothetical protein
VGIARRVALAAAAWCVLTAALPRVLSAQVTGPADSARAAALGAAAARAELVTVYGMAAFATTPLILASVVFVSNGDRPPTAVIVAPLAFGWFAGRAAHTDTRLPPALRQQLAGESLEYRQAFTTGYTATLRRRRLTAFGIGTGLGLLGAILFVNFANLD